jgi:hypothetical protein
MFDRLPANIQEIAKRVFERFCQDPACPTLEHRRLKDTDKGRHHEGSLKVSVTHRFRAIYVPDRQSDTNVWYWIGSHEDYNNFVGRI